VLQDSGGRAPRRAPRRRAAARCGRGPGAAAPLAALAAAAAWATRGPWHGPVGTGGDGLSFSVVLSRVSIASPGWLLEVRTPMLVAAAVFGALSVGLVVLLSILDWLLDATYQWNADIKRCLQAHLFVCATGMLFYSSGYSSTTLFVVTEDSVGGEHLIGRNFHWLISTPIEWYIYKLCFVCPGNRSNCMMMIVYALCVAMQIFGILVCVAPFPNLSLVASSGCFVLMFVVLYQVPQVPETAMVGRRVLDLHLLLWSAYPIAHFCRVAGWMTVGKQQVFVHCTLDCCAKGLSFGAILVARLTRTLTSMTGAIQTMLATHDVVLIVDSSFQLLEPLRNQSLLFHKFAQVEGSTRSLLELCASEEHSERLKTVAQEADCQASGKGSPNCTLSFKLQQDLGELSTTCFVSSCVQGRRLVGISFIVQGEEYAPLTALRQADATEAFDHASAMSCPHSDAHPSGAALEPVLHRCSAILQLAPWLSELVRAIFEDSPTVPSALMVFDRKRGEGASIETASAAFCAHASGLPAPFALSELLGHRDVERLLATASLEELSTYQFRCAELASGTRVVLSVAWLNRLSRAGWSSDVRVGVLTLEPVSSTWHVPLREQVEAWDLPRAAECHYFWYFVADRLLRVPCPLDYRVVPPELLRTAPSLARAAPALEASSCCYVITAEPIESLEPSAGSSRGRRTELVLPAGDWQGEAPPLGERLADADLAAARLRPGPEHLVPPPPALQPLAYARAEDAA
ncbi:unnamed protein product, partial [Prorocentrum cordatum]